MVTYGIKNCAKLAFYGKSDGLLKAYFPFGNSLKISVSGDKAEATANGSTVITWQANRKATAELTTMVVNPKILAIILGASETSGAGTMARFETFTVDSATGTVTLSETPSTGTLSVMIVDSDGATVKSELTLEAGASATDTTYKITGKILTFSTNNKGKNVLCIYAKDETALTTTTIKSTEFAQAYKIVGLGTVKGVDGVERLQMINIPNTTASSSADFTYDASNPASFTFTFDISEDTVSHELFSFKSL